MDILLSLKRLFLQAVLALPLVLRAEVTVSPLFGDHAVLQKAAKVPVWGMAAPGEVVTVSIAGTSAMATADANGAWRAVLDLSTEEAGPFELTIQGAAGSKAIVATDILVGEVWLASGQSNMEFGIGNEMRALEILPQLDLPSLHLFLVPKRLSAEPQSGIVPKNLEGQWVVCTPENAVKIGGWNGFSAVALLFGREIQAKLGQPVGLIGSYWGGTPVEGWTRREALDTVPDLKEGADKSVVTFQGFPAQAKAYEEAFEAWEQQNDRALLPPDDVSPYAGTAVTATPETGWEPVKLPGTLAAAGLPDAGAIWLRRTVTLGAADVTARAAVDCGPIPGCETFYWNGERLAGTKPTDGGVTGNRHDDIDAQVKLQPGEGVFAVRIAAPVGGAALPNFIRWGNVDLAGEWQAKVEKELPPLSPEAKAAFPPWLPKSPRESDVASRLYNGMIAPLVPYAIRGAIWYQGETNAGRAFQYRTSFPLMITDWRAQWGEGDFPFYFCQLANYTTRATVPGGSDWAELREAQTKTLSLPNTGMAVLIDCGDEDDVHPRDKETPASRLAVLALANTYGNAIPFSGPVYESMTVEGDAVRVRFTHVGGADGGLVAKPIPADYAPKSLAPDIRKPLVRNVPQSQLEGFAVCGEDHKWFWAQATIDGDTVVVRAKDVPQPVAVRYAWANNPLCNLYNGAGFPAGPFRSDAFPGVTEKNKF